jgi:energy-coupling factor transporter ATP-binding protein EcfA2
MRAFDIRPYDDSCETILYKNPHFEFKPGITILLGCNGAGKTTLIRRMVDLLKKENVPTWPFLKQKITNDIEARQYYTGDISTMVQMMSKGSTSEGEFAKSQFAHMLQGLGSAVTSTKYDSKERWIFMDGIDSSLSEDQLDDVNGLFDAIIETAPKGIDVYLVATTNQFALAKDHHCILVTNGKQMVPKTYTSYRSTILRSGRYKQNPRVISDNTWERKYSKLKDSTYITKEEPSCENKQQPQQ